MQTALIGHVAILESGAKTTLTALWLHELIEGDAMVRVATAAAKHLDAWLADHDLRPEQISEARWRGGFIVSVPDARPMAMPTRAELAAASYQRRTDPADPFVPYRTADLIGEAKMLDVPAARVPPIVEERRTGVVEKVVNMISGRA